MSEKFKAGFFRKTFVTSGLNSLLWTCLIPTQFIKFILYFYSFVDFSIINWLLIGLVTFLIFNFETIFMNLFINHVDVTVIIRRLVFKPM